MNISSPTRRDFVKFASAVACSVSIERSIFSQSAESGSFAGTLCLFSKHLPLMPPAQMAKAVKKLGLGGIDLTVRLGGHVLPERASEDLPKAIEAIRAEGVSVPMITTNLTSASDPTARPILSTAGKSGIPYYKPGYYKYNLNDVRKELDQFAQEFRALTDLSKQYGVQAGFHNHEGYLGSPLWDVASVIDRLDPKWVGYYFDIRHAVAEGSVSAWKIAFNLVAPRIKMIAVKDSYPEKTSKGWKQRNCPLGEGQVDWTAYFELLRQANFQGPVSLHLEYDIPGKTDTEREDNTLVAAQRDLEFLKARLKEAYPGV